MRKRAGTLALAVLLVLGLVITLVALAPHLPSGRPGTVTQVTTHGSPSASPAAAQTPSAASSTAPVPTSSAAAPPPAPPRSAFCAVSWGMYETATPWDNTMAGIRSLDTSLGRHSQIIHWYAQWGDHGSGSFSSNQPRLLDNVRRYASMGVTGSTPLITWEPWGPNYTVSSQDFPLSAIAAGTFDAYVDSWAQGLRDYGQPVLLLFAHEMNGNWYPWGYGVNGNTPAQYAAAFRHVHDRFVLAGATNVKFVWGPDAWSPSGIATTAFYPGDAYVDWMGIDVYNWNSSWSSLAPLLRRSYGQLTALNATAPLILPEFASQAAPPPGANPASQAAWVIDAARVLVQQFPRIRAAVWFNEKRTAFAFNSSPQLLAAAKAAFGNC
jgi:beta-mannanase